MSPSKILSIDHPDAIPAAKKIIQNSGTIVIPTDTIYGIAADAFSPRAIQKIYDAKERPEEKALPVLIGHIDQLDLLLRFVSDDVLRIAAAFWPGPLTLVLPKGPKVPPDLSPYPTIGVRMPDLAFTLSLLQKTGPLAATSANLSGGPNPTTVQDVLAQLGARADLILDGGPSPGPLASTVVDATASELKILREGPISLEDLNNVLNQG